MLSLFKRKQPTYRTPGGRYYTTFEDMALQPHLLIAGATGSGKSIVINGIMKTLLTIRPPCSAGFVLIDPKRVELSVYRNVPHVLCYASEPDSMLSALEYAMDITEGRYREMQRQGIRKYEGGDVYVIIDELADLMTTDKKNVQPLLQRLCQIGRAARVHVIAATQCPLSAVIPTPIKVNFDARVALRTRSAQDSRNILGVNGCELLPRFGQGYYMKPGETILYNIPYTSDEEIAQLVDYWTSERCIVRNHHKKQSNQHKTKMEDKKMKTINYKGSCIEISAIRFTFADENTIQEGILLHDTTDEFSNGDMIYGVPFDSIQDADDLTQLFEDTGCTVFTKNNDGTYHAEA